VIASFSSAWLGTVSYILLTLVVCTGIIEWLAFQNVSADSHWQKEQGTTSFSTASASFSSHPALFFVPSSLLLPPFPGGSLCLQV
jgi:hypothetical protein